MNTTLVKHVPLSPTWSPIITMVDESSEQENGIEIIRRLAKGHVTENVVKTKTEEDTGLGTEEWEDVGEAEENGISFDLPGLSGLFDYLEARIALRKKSLLLAPTPIHLRAPASTFSENELIEGLIACGYNVVTQEQFNLPPVDVTKPPCVVLIRRPAEWQSALAMAWASYSEDVVWLVWDETLQPLNLPHARWLVFDLFIEANRPTLITTLWSRFAEWLELPDSHLPPDLVNDLSKLPENLLEAAVLALAHVVSRGVDLDEPFELYSLPLLAHLDTENAQIKLELESVRSVMLRVLQGINDQKLTQFVPRGRLLWQVFVSSGDVLPAKVLRLTMALRDKRFLQLTFEGAEPCSSEAAAELVVQCNNWTHDHPESPAVLVQLEKGVQVQQRLLIDIESRPISLVKQHLSTQISAALEFWKAVNRDEQEDSE